jgi:HTH-type transcriptional regulator/antitoxin HigA
MGRPAQAINEIIRGVKAIEPATAFQLERVLGTPAHFWLRLEQNHQYNKARLSELEQLRDETQCLPDFPYAAIARLGWVPHTRDPLDRMRNLLRFFEAGSCEAVKSMYPDALHRVSGTHSPSWQSLAAWLRGGERLAAGIEVAPYDADALVRSLDRVRRMTRSQPAQFCGELRGLMASCGVALVFVPHLPKSYAHGATRWLSASRALVQLSLRYRWADIFWFSLFHELGHILRHGKRRVFVEFEDRPETSEEQEADRFAAEALLPSAAYRDFVRAGTFSAIAIRQFACAERIHEGIIVGRLQHEGRLSHSHLNRLRERYVFAGEPC